jgi:hypothetical protein
MALPPLPACFQSLIQALWLQVIDAIWGLMPLYSLGFFVVVVVVVLAWVLFLPENLQS